jgi:uncharacterized protein (TIGR03083 family)
MPDDAELRDLDPYDLMDEEAARLDAYFVSLGEDDWAATSACDGWDVHDVLAHLAGSETYNHACLDDAIGALFEEVGPKGVTDVESFNALGVSERSATSHADLLEEWRASCGRTRRDLRSRRGGDISTMVGSYPADWQAWHLASELATHADDIGVPVDPADVARRTDWRARFSRFALAESKPDLPVTAGESGTTVTVGDSVVVLDDESLIAAVSARTTPVAYDEEILSGLRALA